MSQKVRVDDDRFHDRCGLFGIFRHGEAANLTYLGLYALQHRGQESAGIVTSDGEKVRCEKGMGLVNDVFDDKRLQALPGNMAIGHVRYSTAGDTVAENAQPYLIDCHRGPIAVCHNGNLVNAATLKQQLEAAGAIFQSNSDTEVILHLYARSHKERLEDAISASLTKLMGAFSLLFLTRDSLVAARDPWGFRPLVVGTLGDATIVTSETCALDLIDAEYVREVEPGELLVIDASGMRSFRPFPPSRRRSASSSTSTSRGRTAWCSAATCSSRGWRSAASSRARRPRPPTSWCRCPTAAWARRSATRRRAGCRSSGA
jgi:amidophosphoribosyltransferase